MECQFKGRVNLSCVLFTPPTTPTPHTHRHRKATNSTLPAAAGDWTYDLLAMRQIVQPTIEPKDVTVQAEYEHAHKDSTGGQVQSRQCKGVCFVTLLLPPSGLRSFDTCCLNVFWPAVGSPHSTSFLFWLHNQAIDVSVIVPPMHPTTTKNRSLHSTGIMYYPGR